MPLSLKRYLSAHVGRAPDGRPIDAAAPCADGTKRRFAVPIGKAPDGKAMFAHGECRNGLIANHRYAGKFAGIAPDGRPIYQVPCVSCNPCTGPTTISGLVTGCSGTSGAEIPGATVALDRITPDPENDLETQVSDSDGCVTFDLNRPGFGPGTYRMRATSPTVRLNNGTSANVVINCGNNFGCGNPTAIGLPVNSAYQCLCACSPYPWSRTLFLTTKWGTVTLQEPWVEVFGGSTIVHHGTWAGYQTIHVRAATKYRCFFVNPPIRVDPTSYLDGQAVTVLWLVGPYGADCMISTIHAAGWDATANKIAFLADSRTCIPLGSPAGCGSPVDCATIPTGGDSLLFSANCSSFTFSGTFGFGSPFPSDWIESTPVALNE